MRDLDALYDVAHERNIIVVDSHLTEIKKAASISAGDIDVIVLDYKRIRSKREERLLFTEELGHICTGAMQLADSFLNSPLGRYNRSRIENKARRYAMQVIVPFDELYEQIPNHCYDGNLDIQELSDYFDVDAQYMITVIETYRTMGRRLPTIP